MTTYGIWLAYSISPLDGEWLLDTSGIVFNTQDIGVARAQKKTVVVKGFEMFVRVFYTNGMPGTVVIDSEVMEGNKRPVPANPECREEIRNGKVVSIGTEEG